MQKVTPPAWWRGPLVLAAIGVLNVPNVNICYVLCCLVTETPSKTCKCKYKNVSGTKTELKCGINSVRDSAKRS